MLFEQIRKERQTAANLLLLMSFFNSQGIPESSLRVFGHKYARAAAWGRLNGCNPQLENGDADEAFEIDLDTLQAYSLVLLSIDTETCKMHPLVQFCTRVWLSRSGYADYWQYVFVDLMAHELLDTEYENCDKVLKLLPHVGYLFTLQPVSEDILKPWSRVLTVGAFYLHEQGKLITSQEAAKKALDTRERIFGHDDLKTLDTAEILGFALVSQNRCEDAREP